MPVSNPTVSFVEPRRREGQPPFDRLRARLVVWAWLL